MDDENKNVTPPEGGADDSAKQQDAKKPDTAAGKSEDTTPEQEPEKTFTQAELDKIINDRLARAKKEMPSKDDLAAFKKWQDDQKTEAQKNADALNEAKTAADLAQAELARFKQLDAVRKSGVEEKFVGYVNFEVAQLAAEKNVGFDEALVSFLKANASYKKQETREIKVDTSPKDKPADKPLVDFNFIGVRPKK